MSEENNVLIEEEATTVTEDSPKSKKKKAFKVAGVDAYGMYYLGFEGGGELPDSLKNAKYTGIKEAEQAAEALNEGR